MRKWEHHFWEYELYSVYPIYADILPTWRIGWRICFGFFDIIVAIHGIGLSVPTDEDNYSEIFFQWYHPTIRLYHSRYMTTREIRFFPFKYTIDKPPSWWYLYDIIKL